MVLEGGGGWRRRRARATRLRLRFGDLGLLPDEEKAKEWYQKAAEGGDNGAQRRLDEACEYRGSPHLRNSQFLKGKGSDLPLVSYF